MPSTQSKHSPSYVGSSGSSHAERHRGIPDPVERLPNLQIHGRGFSGFPPFGGKGHRGICSDEAAEKDTRTVPLMDLLAVDRLVKNDPAFFIHNFTRSLWLQKFCQPSLYVAILFTRLRYGLSWRFKLWSPRLLVAGSDKRTGLGVLVSAIFSRFRSIPKSLNMTFNYSIGVLDCHLQSLAQK